MKHKPLTLSKEELPGKTQTHTHTCTYERNCKQLDYNESIKLLVHAEPEWSLKQYNPSFKLPRNFSWIMATYKPNTQIQGLRPKYTAAPSRSVKMKEKMGESPLQNQKLRSPCKFSPLNNILQKLLAPRLTKTGYSACRLWDLEPWNQQHEKA